MTRARKYNILGKNINVTRNVLFKLILKFIPLVNRTQKVENTEHGVVN